MLSNKEETIKMLSMYSPSSKEFDTVINRYIAMDEEKIDGQLFYTAMASDEIKNNRIEWRPPQTGGPSTIIQADCLFYMEVFYSKVSRDKDKLSLIQELLNTTDKDNHIMAREILLTIDIK